MAGVGSLGRLKDKVRSSLRGRAEGGGRGSGSKPRVDPEADPGLKPETSEGGIAVSYEPAHDGDADPGEVVWTWVAYEDDPSQGKDRPVLVIGWDGPRLAVVPLSSKDHAERRDAREWVPVGAGGWDVSGRPSYADAARLLRVAPSAVRREGAALERGHFDEVLARVRELHDW